MKCLGTVMQLLLAIVFLFFGGMKLIGLESVVESFTDELGYSIAFLYTIGVLEVLAAIGLIIGFWKSKWVPLSAGVIAIIMVGALGTLISAEKSLAEMVPAAVCLLFSAFLIFNGDRRRCGADKAD
ncbi:DoxX family protein [Mechercharimyces sp. CAU 1602]|uniref:DoxX family protein n=1 Tax=Mechercharimyces sp. CAU 1602 TaxID=2973933 RepID=UPI002162BD0E|nr:DoxX family protein [Mechercharimyces sp. CAU 1602]MCS1350702.1 DoxX family protein [Mechercharimyces sp. CAU 1602]